MEQIDERVIASTGEIKPVLAFKQLPYYGVTECAPAGAIDGDLSALVACQLLPDLVTAAERVVL